MDFGLIYKRLFAYCRERDFAGDDPFDGLNSRLFQATPLKKFALPRLFWAQAVKRSPFNLRRFLQISPGTNSKGVALFALAELSRFRATKDENHAANAKYLLEKLLALKVSSPKSQVPSPKAKAAFSYNFDWQSRAFYAPQGTPTIVPTAFAARALLEAFDVFHDEIYLETTREICEFIVSDLNRSAETEDEICFSYTPLDRSIIFNPSLLAGETLAFAGALDRNRDDKNHEWLTLAEKSARFVLRRQAENGAWHYGTKLRHKWVDNFHTAFILASLRRMKPFLPALEKEIQSAVKRGCDFWVKNCFLADGTPKYYDNKIYPIDIHSAAAAIAALCDLKDVDKNALRLAEKVAVWTIENLRDDAGFFYYQKQRFYTVKIPHIRWAQAWTAFALARLIEETADKHE